MKQLTSAQQETLKHIMRVQELMFHMRIAIAMRSMRHDASKLKSPEVKMFEKFTSKLRGMTFMSAEYKRCLKNMPALKHHYRHNSHHPEYFKNGMNGMTLVDLCEMFCDWLAATERHANGDIYKSIRKNTKRFKMSKQMAAILRNTAVWMKSKKPLHF